MYATSQELCNSAATRLQSPVADLRLITLPEVTQVLRTFNAWDLPYTDLLNPEHQTIHGMFEHWAKHTPDAPSLTFGVGDLVLSLYKNIYVCQSRAAFSRRCMVRSAAGACPSQTCLGEGRQPVCPRK